MVIVKKDPLITNEGEPINIKKFFPVFYKANKEAIDNGTIIAVADEWATHTGAIIDFSTKETLIIDLDN